ncbi:hypothetical protein Tco_0827138 [Tanacetum coccineum]
MLPFRCVVLIFGGVTNPTIYVSLIKKFWQTAIVRTVDNGEQEITATVDDKEFTITEAYIRRHLQLADVDGISFFPTTEMFAQLSQMGYVLTDDKLTFQKDKHKRFFNPHNRKYIAPTLTPKLFSNMKRGFSGEQTPLFPSMLAIQAQEGEGSGHPSKPQPPPFTAQPIHEEPIPNVVSSSHQTTQTPRQALNQVTEVERAITTAASLDAAQASGNITKTQSTTIPNVPLPQGIGAKKLGGSIAQTMSEKVPTPPRDSPLPRVNILGSDEGSMSLQELTVLCTKLFSKVESLEADLKQTKQVYGAAYTKLIMKVKKLEKTVKTSQARRRAKIVVSDDEEDLEDSSKQGRMIEEIDQDAGVTLVTPTHSQEDQPEDQLGVFSAAKVLADAAKNVHTYTRRRRAVSTGSGGVSTASRLFSTAEESVSTAGASMPVSTAGMVQEVNKDKGKGIMTESEPEQTKTKLQQRQERAGYEAAVRLQEQLDEEERQRIARVHEEASSFNIEEWEDIQATIEADEELAQRIQAEEREKYSKAEKARLLVELINLRKRYFVQQRDEERRNKPLTQAQQRTYMSNYIKHMGSHTLQQLKRLSFDELKALFETTMRMVQTFHPIESEGDKIVHEVTTGSSKKDAEVELDHEGSKKQKTNEASGSV